MSTMDEDIKALNGMERTTAKNHIRQMKAEMGVDSTKYSDATRQQIIQSVVAGQPLVSVTGESTEDEIIEAGLFHGRKTEDHWHFFCECVAALRDHCDRKQGGSDFSKIATSRWPISSGQASECLKVGKALKYFSEFRELIPAARSAQIELAKLPEEAFIEHAEAGDIKPDMTAKQAKALNTPKPQPQTAQQPRGDVPPPSDPDAVEVTFEELEDEPEVDSVAEALEEAGVEPLDPNDKIPGIRQMSIVALDHKLEGLNTAQKRAVRQFINHTVSQRVYRKVQEQLPEKIKEEGQRLRHLDTDLRNREDALRRGNVVKVQLELTRKELKLIRGQLHGDRASANDDRRKRAYLIIDRVYQDMGKVKEFL